MVEEGCLEEDPVRLKDELKYRNWDLGLVVRGVEVGVGVELRLEVVVRLNFAILPAELRLEDAVAVALHSWDVERIPLLDQDTIVDELPSSERNEFLG